MPRSRLIRRWLLAGLLLGLPATPAALAGVPGGLVGHWTFDDGTGRDHSGGGHTMVLGEARVRPLGEGRACLQIEPGRSSARIPVPAGSPLAIAQGTICFWLNLGVNSSATLLEFDNRAVQLRVYRSHFQPRFRGAGTFDFGSGLLGPDWPEFLLREAAFYPHERAVTGEGEWHHFAVAYDPARRRIVGWRDGERIGTVDLSTAGMEPLRRADLTAIVTGRDFSGLLDELRIYDRPLEDADVQRIHAAERGAYQGRKDAVAASRELRVYSYAEEDRSLYQAWLQHRPQPPPGSPELIRRIVAAGEHPAIRNAARELATALGRMYGPVEVRPADDPATPAIVLGTPDSSEWIRARAGALGVTALQHDGYVLKTVAEPGAAPAIVVAAREPAGVVFGAFALIRALQLGADPARLDQRVSPAIAIRMVNHWDLWRGFPHDDWRGRETEDDEGGELNRSKSIFSWDEVRRGDTRRIRDWARLLASAGWNALCPTEINWEPRNNFLEHLDEVKVLADLLREYGIRLYWSPNYLLALRRETADRLYAVVPDFGGYLLKLGSEAQEGDPRPAMVNRIADHLRPHGGHALVRAFVYGKYRYSPDDIRNLNPYDVIAPHDGAYRENVVIVSKGSPLDWDLSAPIPALDGAIRRNAYGSELVIAKHWPLSWIEKWKWWLEQDHRREGPGSYNKSGLRCLLGVAMINPAPAWTASPLNMVNYFGLGRLAQNPNLSVDEIYRDWIRLTFGDEPAIIDPIATVLRLTDDVTRKLYIYRGYRGVWIDRRDRTDLVQNKTPHTITREGVGTASPALRERVLAQYAPGLRAIYEDPVRGEEFFASFNFLPLDHRLTSGRTVMQDLFANLDEAVDLAQRLPRIWQQLAGRIDERQFEATLASLQELVRLAERERAATIKGLESVTGRRHSTTVAQLAPDNRAASRYYDVRDFAARGDGTGDDAPAIAAAISAAHAAGGGTVFVPAGVYPCGPIALRSHVTLALDPGALLRATAGTAALLGGDGLEHVAIIGPGELEAHDAGAAVILTNISTLVIRGVTMVATGQPALQLRDCRDVLVDLVTIDSAGDGLVAHDCSDLQLASSRITAAGEPLRLSGRTTPQAVTRRDSVLTRPPP